MRRLTLPSRIAAALLGGYAFTWGFTVLLISAAVAAGQRYGEALQLAYLLAFLVFLIAFLWAFAARQLWRVWALLAGGGGLMTLVAHGLQGA